jgi:two-component system, LytTR family, response regulator
VEAAGNYVEVHTVRKAHLVRHTVKAMEAKLDPERFLRVRPSAIVSTAHVTGLSRRSGGDYVVVLSDGTHIRSSRSYRARIEEVFGKPSR